MASKLLALIFLGLNIASANAALLNGSINLPSGVVSGSGTQFLISTQPNLGVQSTVTIASSQSSAPYSLNLPNGASYRVRFDCVSGCQGLDITTAGFWRQAPAGIVGFEANATSYLSAQNQTVNIQLGLADTFSGVINLPEEFIATGDETLVATVTAAVFGDAAVFRQVISTQEGETSWPFTIGVPAAETGGGWNFDVQCENCDVDIADQVHYPTSVAGDPASLEIGSRFFYLKNRDNLAMELTLISIAEPEPSDETLVIAPILLLLDDDQP